MKEINTDRPSLPSIVNPQAPPPPMAPTLGPAESRRIVDTSLNVWSIDREGRTLRNGEHVGNGFAVGYRWVERVLYAKGTDSQWRKLTGDEWKDTEREPSLS